MIYSICQLEGRSLWYIVMTVDGKHWYEVPKIWRSRGEAESALSIIKRSKPDPTYFLTI